MSKICEICGKRPHAGNKISHSGKKSTRWWYPNIQKVRIKLPDGRIKRVKICTRCLKAGKIQKAIS